MKLGDNVLGSVCQSFCLSFCLYVRPLTADIKRSALPSAAKSNKSHYQSKVFVFVFGISEHIWINHADVVDGFLIYNLTLIEQGKKKRFSTNLQTIYRRKSL